MAHVEMRPKPALRLEYCKGCERCIEACHRGCIEPGHEIHSASGLVPVVLHLEQCNGCGLCVDACPEPYGLVSDATSAVMIAADARRGVPQAQPPVEEIPAAREPLLATRPLMVKGAHAAALGALIAGCRHFFGYPITPSTEGAELMAKLLPKVGGRFVQAASEVAAVNMMYGSGAAGRPAMSFTSGPGLSLMLEGLSYMIGAELPGVIVDVMRAGPGLGNIAPEQSDVKLACRGLGHGSTHAIVLAPATPQEMLDFTALAFELSVRYRNPVLVLADGHLGQMTGKVLLPDVLVRPGLPAWAVAGDAAHRRNLVSSILLDESDQEAHERRLFEKYARMTAAEQRADLFCCDDAEVLLVACNTPSRVAKGAVRTLRAGGIAAGLFRPQTLWPFPVEKLLPLVARARRVVVVEASEGQLEDEMRLALSHAGVPLPAVSHVRRHGGHLPSQDEIVQAVKKGARKVVAA
jgi:2-oxoglutarate ferredoxin oxidoreductase subunit alpha/2-oxoisovalerate ferredoxin oxidoreductase alpha subunit